MLSRVPSLYGAPMHSVDPTTLTDQVAFIPPSAWEGQTVARFAFLHPDTSIDLVRQILDRMA